MFRPGHYGMVLLLYSVVGYALISKRYGDRAVAGTGLVVLVTMIPDWDTHASWLPHRGPTHSLGFALVVGAVLAMLVVLHGRRRGQDLRSVVGLGAWAAGLGTFSVMAHVLADALNPMGVRPLYPLSDRHISFDLFSASDPVANFGLLAAGLLATAGWWRLADDRVVQEVPAPAVLLRRLYRYVRGPAR